MSHCVLLEFPIALLVRVRPCYPLQFVVLHYIIVQFDFGLKSRTLSNPSFVRPESNARRVKERCRQLTRHKHVYDYETHVKVRACARVCKSNRPFWQRSRREGRQIRD